MLVALLLLLPAQGVALVQGTPSLYLLHWIGFIVISWWAWGAGWYRALPAWLASMMQLPGPLKVTVEPEIEHIEVLEESMVKVTGLPEAPPDAVTS
jgi:hypothetical protein